MQEQLIDWISQHMGGASPELVIFIISLVPILELRGGLLAATMLKVPMFKAALICIIGNIIPVPFILILIVKVLEFMKKFKHLRPFVEWLEKKADKHKGQVEKYGYLGLTLFVGIPLPGTGAWTGALIASLMKMDVKKSFLAILIGLPIATVIMCIVSYGGLNAIINLFS